MELTDDQQRILNDIEQFLNDDTQVYILKGYAGTGKTTLLTYVLKMLKAKQMQCQLMAPTGRAAKIIREKTHCDATTIHKGIYDVSRLEESKEYKGDIHFFFPIIKDDGHRNLMIIDEASMISSVETQNEIFRFGTGILLNDLLTCAHLHNLGKILFIGDPAQLPPVSDPKSLALDKTYFESLGYKVKEDELTQVLRQSDNEIKHNALAIRKKLENADFTDLSFELKEGEVEQVSNVVEHFCNHFDANSSSNPIIITYSNNTAWKNNNEIRSILHPHNKSVTVDDKLLCVSNNYNVLGCPVFNGDFLKVVSAEDEVEVRTAPVWVNKNGVKQQIPVSVAYRNVVVQTDDGRIIEAKLVDSLLDNDSRGLTVEEIKSIYVDFCLRNKNLESMKNEFMEKLVHDPYVNALKAKYGYAITCHKAQGGEWDEVYVDFTGQQGDNEHSLRWIYTAVTRAKKRLLSPRFPINTLYKKMKVAAITTSTSSPKEFTDVKIVKNESSEPASAMDTPFHSDESPDFLKNKYIAIDSSLADTHYSVVNVAHYPYMEKYSLRTPSGIFDYNIYYNQKKQYKYMSCPSCPEDKEILQLLAQEPAMEPASDVSYEVNYEPGTDSLKHLYEKMKALCEAVDCKIVNIVEYSSSYYVRYCLKTSSAFSYIDFFWNDKKFITYVRPVSAGGAKDVKLQTLLNIFVKE